jgi:hypothetical protein
MVLFALARAARGQTGTFEVSPGTRVLAPIQYERLAVFPVVQAATPAAAPANMLTLSDGLKRKLIKVSERGPGGEVNRVEVENRSNQSLLLLGGELILGGQQDRIIGKDTVVEPHQKLAVEVYCVEHGRWSGHRAFTAAGGVASNKIRMRAKYKSDQGQVWREVADKNHTLGGENATGTYRGLATGEAGARAVSPYREHVGAKLDASPDSARMIGLIAVVDGRITSADLFDNPRLFASYRPRLLDAIYLSAAGEAPSGKPGQPLPSASDIKSFLARADAAAPQELTQGKQGKRIEKKADGVMKSEIVEGAGPAAKSIYRSYQADE